MTPRYRLVSVAFTLLLFQIFILTGCSEKNWPPESRLLLPQGHKTSLTHEEERGEILYEYYCALCHGKKGEGDGFNSFNLKTPPAKHTDSTVMGTLSDTQIQQIIKDGGAAQGRSPEMHPWGGVLNNKQISDLTAFIRTLAKQDGNAVRKQ